MATIEQMAQSGWLYNLPASTGKSYPDQLPLPPVNLTGEEVGGVMPLLYSNNPESVAGFLADDGYWLVQGSTEVGYHAFGWHLNNTGVQIQSALQVFNPGPNNVIVTINRVGVAGDSGV